MTQQLLYVAVGPMYLRMALRSAGQAQAAGFLGGVVIVTDQVPPATPPANTTFAAVATPAGDLPFAASEYKTRFLDFATADQVLFLDCDTLVKADVTPAFVAGGHRHGRGNLAHAGRVLQRPARLRRHAGGRPR